MAKNLPVPKALKHALMTRDDRARKAAEKNAKAKLSKTTKGKKTLAKKSKKKNAASKSKKAKDTKEVKDLLDEVAIGDSDDKKEPEKSEPAED